MNRLASEKTGFLAALVCICFCMMAVLIVILSSINLIEKTSAFTALLCFVLPLFCLSIVIAVFMRSGNSSRLFGFLLLITAFLLKSAIALAIHTQPESDFYILYDAAKQLAQGVNILGKLNYFYYWPYQSAFVAWMALFIKLFGADVVFFKLMNCLFSALTTLLIYLLARRFASERGARVAAVVFLLYPGTFLMVSVLTNQHLSEFLMLSALYLFTTPSIHTKWMLPCSVIAAVLLALSNAIRPNGIIMILAVLVYIVIQIFSRFKDRQTKRKEFVRAAVLIVSYFLISISLSGLVQAAGLNVYGLKNNVPEWKWILGLNEQYDGQYNEEDEKAVFGGGVDQAAAERLMRERLSISPPGFLQLALRKSEIMWGSLEPTFWAFTGNVCAEIGTPPGPFSLSRLLLNVRKFTGGLYIWINLLIALGALIPFRRKRISETHMLLMLIALAYFCVLLLIEVQTRYRSLMTVMTFPLIAAGTDAVIGGLTRRKTQERQMLPTQSCEEISVSGFPSSTN